MKDINKLDAVFSRYIRLRDSNANGYVRCYCCGYQVHWRLAHNMHYISRRHMATRFYDKNCHAGCPACNLYNGGNLEAYADHLKRDYGDGIIDQLTMLKNTFVDYSEDEVLEMIKYYEGEIKKMQ